MKVLGVHFAPLWMPLERRMQTLAVLGGVILLLAGPPASWLFFFWAIIYSPSLWIPATLYGFWIYWDRASYEGGRRRSSWARNWRWWNWCKAYFPVSLKKTSPLEPDRSYLFTMFPHGVVPIGAFFAFMTDSCDFGKVFPGLRPLIVTLNINFITPFIREIALALGCIPADEGCMVRALSKKGNAVCLSVGGAEEAFHSKPGQYNIIVARRRGFIRIALKSGASLVPIIVFGEPETYDQFHFAPGSFLRWVQDKIKKLTGVAPVVMKGRGVFQYTYGLLPFRASLTVVAGTPIPVPKVENPTKAQIDEWHAVFCEHLTALFNGEKQKYLKTPVELNFIK